MPHCSEYDLSRSLLLVWQAERLYQVFRVKDLSWSETQNQLSSHHDVSRWLVHPPPPVPPRCVILREGCTSPSRHHTHRKESAQAHLKENGNSPCDDRICGVFFYEFGSFRLIQASWQNLEVKRSYVWGRRGGYEENEQKAGSQHIRENLATKKGGEKLNQPERGRKET